MTGQGVACTINAMPAEQSIRSALHDPLLMEAALALAENRLPDAEPRLRAYLRQDPFNVAAIRMMAELAARIGRLGDAEKLLRRALELAPEFNAARANLATVLHRMHRSQEAIAELDRLMLLEPENSGHANLKAAASGRIGEYEEALRLYDRVLAQHPRHAKVWMSKGHILKTLGRQAEAVDAYRRALELAPGLGEAWWSLANLKTVRFADADVAAMEAAAARDDLADEDRFHLDFALGKALEDRGAHDRSFHRYDSANRLRRAHQPYDAAETSAAVDRQIALLTPAFLAARAGQGHDAPDPIFVLGMPRAGSTLIEQVLASHSWVEGTMELPDMPQLLRQAEKLGGVAALTPEQRAELGRQYLERTQIQRKTGKPFFIDKLPNNWLHTGFIHLILPNATIIDARRNPLSCCFSNFKQHFARGQAFSYSLSDMGRYYADYVRLMDHVDSVLPGRVIRVFHEDMLDDSDASIRRLLEACGLPFEEACLRFWETERAVRTASSEQVRRPIFRDGADAWQAYDAHLDPLRAALGDAMQLWRCSNAPAAK